MEKQQGRRLKPIELIKKVTLHMNNVNSTKYELAPETIEKRSLDPNDGEYFQEIYDFMRLKKIGNNRLQIEKDVPGNLYKASTENIPFFNRDRIFTIYKRAKLENGIYLYWLEEKGRKIIGRFLRQEIFALNKQFLR